MLFHGATGIDFRNKIRAQPTKCSLPSRLSMELRRDIFSIRIEFLMTNNLDLVYVRVQDVL